MQIENSVAVITGGGSGIGRALALALAREGADVIIADIDHGAAERVAAEVREAGRQALAVRCDVAQEREIEALVGAAVADFGRIDIFVNNAGVLLGGRPEDVTDSDWAWIMDINFYAHVYAVRHALPHMLRANRGCLVHIASAAGLVSTGTNIPYHVSKHAVVALAGGLAVDLQARGSAVTVACVCPEVVSTNLPERSFQAGDIGRAQTEAERAAHNDVAEAMKMRMATRGLDPDAAAAAIVEGIKAGRHLIYTHERTHATVVRRAEDPEQGIRDAVSVLQREQERMREFEAARAKR